MPRLLIVDDEIDVREFAARFFRKRNIEVDTAAGGEEALGLAQKNKPDLILLDIVMEGIDGIETLKRLREWDNQLKIIMVTGRKPEEDSALEKCKQLGAMDYIHKPLELDELEKTVLSVLNRKS